jgi:hypothetical protein
MHSSGSSPPVSLAQKISAHSQSRSLQRCAPPPGPSPSIYVAIGQVLSLLPRVTAREWQNMDADMRKELKVRSRVESMCVRPADRQLGSALVHCLMPSTSVP